MALLLAWLDRIPAWVWVVLSVLLVFCTSGFNHAADKAVLQIIGTPSIAADPNKVKVYWYIGELNRNIAFGCCSAATIFLVLAVRAFWRRPSKKG
jgi:hypothetical protein